MISSTKITTIYNCSLERAFKTPMLCDVSKVHTGYGLMPKVTHCTEDDNWGKPGYSKKVFVARSISQKGGWASTDKVIERIENQYWKIEVSNFQSWMMGFSDRPDNNRFETAALAKLQIEVVAVTSTKGALARLDKDPEPFDLVLSDWQRPELHLDTVGAGIHLLRQLRKRHLTVPVVFYHGSFDERERVLRRQQAVHEGAFGEAVMPDELFSLIAAALGVE